METNYKIYMYTFPNGKKYIGQTKRTLRARQVDDEWSGYRSCSLLWKAIQKFGTDSIEITILKEHISDKEEADKWEEYYIDFYKTNVSVLGDKAEGYNLTSGGTGWNTYKCSEEELERKRQQCKQFGIARKGKPFTEEHRRKLSEAAKKRPHHPLSEEAKRKISIKNSRENLTPEERQHRSDSKKKKTIIINKITGEKLEFKSRTEAAEYFNTSLPRMSDWCHGKAHKKTPEDWEFNQELTANRD